MEIVRQISQNMVFVTAFFSWALAQIIKTIIHFFVAKEFNAERLVGAGGMPSCHSATVCSLVLSTGLTCGVAGFEFAVACVFASIVMYDALGVRREAGNQAKLLNELLELFSTMEHAKFKQEKLKEFVGHTPVQVIAGAILGIATTLLLFVIMR